MRCPKCGTSMTVSLDNAFICDDYIDIPTTCPVCKSELRVVYDFTEVTLER